MRLFGRKVSRSNVEFWKISLCFRQGSIRLAAVELFARNGTQPEPRLRTNAAYFKTLYFVGAGRVGKFRVFPKLEIKAEQLECPCTAENKCEFTQSQTRLLEYACSIHQYDNFQNGHFVQLSNFKESISFASDFNSSSVRVRPFPIF